MSPIHVLSESIVCPSERAPAGSKSRCELSIADLALLSYHYIQYGLLFSLPSDSPVETIVYRLKTSLSIVLSHFRPLAGRIAVDESKNGGGISVYIDCNDGGVAFLLSAAAGVRVADVQSEDVPDFVGELFPLDGSVNYDGTFLSLVAVQLTKLDDGFFLGCAFNHAVGDGTAFWNFFNAWAELSFSQTSHLSLRSQPVLERWFPDGCKPPIKLPYTHEDQFIQRYSCPSLRDKFFHFTAADVARLKAEANKDLSTSKISSLQALTACMWRCIVRARRIPENETVKCGLVGDGRRRLSPPLPASYFGCLVFPLSETVTVDELLGHNIGWSAAKIHDAVAKLNFETIKKAADEWLKAPQVYTFSFMEEHCVFVGLSPRFEVYECDFGWGKPVAARSGRGEKFDGMILAYPGREGDGSIDFEVSLSPEAMAALEVDPELTRFASSTIATR